MSDSPSVPTFFNTLRRRLEPFQPLDPPRVKLYSCGPTVYDRPHIGNYRFFVWVDVLHRYLRWRGYDVELVMNITDVDDKTIAGARREGVPLGEYTDRYARAFLDGLDILGVKPATHYPRATEHIDDMVALVRRLLETDHAYEHDGSVYFRVSSFPDYGRLARLEPDEMRSTERVESDDYVKEDPRDFVLWKAAKEGEPSWDTEWGSGRPGWHLECSAMSMRYLGDSFDAHLGGTDLIFPHHENEIAQSEAASGEPLAHTWLHCSHLLVDGVKMSKSLGNFYTLDDLLEEGHEPIAIRYLLASVHYRRQLNFTAEGLEQAAAAVERLRDFVVRGEHALATMEGGGSDEPSPAHEAGQAEEISDILQAAGDDELGGRLRRQASAFAEALDDDLNTAGALGHMFTLVRAANTALDREAASPESLRAVIRWLRHVDSIWGALPSTDLHELEVEHDGRLYTAVGPALDPDLEQKIRERVQARARRDFATADRLRDELADAGVLLEDTGDGVRWRLEG